MKIVTLTLNPAFDVHCDAEGFTPYTESILKITSRDAGGKGVNISKALVSAGVENTAIVVTGSENGDEFCRMLEKDGLDVLQISREGRIRENITLHEKNNPETRISFGGFSVDSTVVDELRRAIGKCDADTVATLTGSIPSGISANAVLNMLSEMKDAGAKIVIDSRSVTLGEILDFKPWLIKPNRDEAEKYFGTKIESAGDAACIAKELCSKGVENVMISLGGDGAVLATNEGCYYARAPKIEVLSTVGAGDSMIAGFIDGAAKDLHASKRLVRAVAFGTAACMREGTNSPLISDVKLVEEKTKIVDF